VKAKDAAVLGQGLDAGVALDQLLGGCRKRAAGLRRAGPEGLGGQKGGGDSEAWREPDAHSGSSLNPTRTGWRPGRPRRMGYDSGEDTRKLDNGRWESAGRWGRGKPEGRKPGGSRRSEG